MDAGLSINIGYDLNQDVSIYPKVESENLNGNETYGGIGINFGGALNLVFTSVQTSDHLPAYIRNVSLPFGLQ